MAGSVLSPEDGQGSDGQETSHHRAKMRRTGSVEVLTNHRCLLSAYFIEHDFPRGIELLQQVKVPNVAGQYRTSVFSSGGE